MPDLKLLPLLEATQPDRLREPLGSLFGPAAEPPRVESTRLQAPICYWVVYRNGGRRVTLKSFFSGDDYVEYVAELRAVYPERLGHPEHPNGGVLLLPEINGILWAFPFDPAMPELHRCFDGAWIAGVLRRRSREAVQPEIVSYRPEIGAVFAYRGPQGRRVVAYGKCSPEESCGRQYVIMNRLWRSPARESGQLRLARPLAFRPEAGLLLQAPVAGTPISGERNRSAFLQLVTAAGTALAAIHGCDAPFGHERQLADLVRRLADELPDLALVSPALHRALGQLIAQIESRSERGSTAARVASHGDFKWDQFLEYRGRFALIDFELFCQAEPSYDLGYFCAYLPPSSPRDWRDSAAAEMLRGVFLHTYAETSGTPLDLSRVALFESGMLALRALSHVWRQHGDWQLRASQLLDLAFERLVNPEPDSSGHPR
ncbi:MAG: phosphotransferase [Chloroflexi bacterium]|nr:phosphotransferase [Chloroflexota bacterium]